jgi:hypothetical protein
VRLIYLVTIDGLEGFVLASHTQRRGTALQIFVVSQILLVLILSAQLLLIEGAIHPRVPVRLGKVMTFFIIGLLVNVGYLVKASFGEGLILEGGNLRDPTLLLHHANVLGVRVLLLLVLMLSWTIHSGV